MSHLLNLGEIPRLYQETNLYFQKLIPLEP